MARAFETEMEIMQKNPNESYLLNGITANLIEKRDRMASILHASGLKPIIPDSGYFMVADFSDIGTFLFFFEKSETSLVHPSPVAAFIS